MRTRATAFAPASCANVAVGFDLMGFALQAVGDHVTVSRIEEPGVVRIAAIEGLEGLPLRPEENTAGAGLLMMAKKLALPFGFEVRIDKNIPVGSGLGGSASSAVAAVVAGNALLDTPFEKLDLLPFAAEGERVASGALHGDNVAPALLGGLVLVRAIDPPEVIDLPVPKGVTVAVVLPKLRIDTKEARKILSPELSRKLWIEQSAHLAGTLVALFRGDVELLRRSFHDVVIEPQRAQLLKGFFPVKKAALDAGAIGCSISGSGPAVFAFAKNKDEAEKVMIAMRDAFEREGVEVFGSWTSPLDAKGAEIVDETSKVKP